MDEADEAELGGVWGNPTGWKMVEALWKGWVGETLLVGSLNPNNLPALLTKGPSEATTASTAETPQRSHESYRPPPAFPLVADNVDHNIPLQRQRF